MVKPVEPEWGALAGDGPLSPAEIDARARALLAQMTLAEKIKQMSGDRSFLFGGIKIARAYNAEPVPAGENRRLGIPGIRFTDGPRARGVGWRLAGGPWPLPGVGRPFILAGRFAGRFFPGDITRRSVTSLDLGWRRRRRQLDAVWPCGVAPPPQVARPPAAGRPAQPWPAPAE